MQLNVCRKLGSVLTIGALALSVSLSSAAFANHFSESIDVLSNPVSPEQILAPFALTPVWKELMNAAESLTAEQKNNLFHILQQYEEVLEGHYFNELPGGRLPAASIYIEKQELLEKTIILSGFLALNHDRKTGVSISIPLSQ